ncbi:MAG: RibD family protein [Cyanobacteria bacterium Co-bin13]|nr:RibD family protein [Cyanobacteria bacterium Co-bin13]
MFPADTSLSLLHSTVILAMSADGKISDFRRTAARFSSKADLAHLEARIAEADAVLIGGGTLRAYGTTLPVRQPALIDQRRQRGQSDQPIHIVWSPSGQLDPTCRFFRQAVPRGLLTTESGAEAWRQAGFDSIWALPGTTSDWNWALALAQLVASGVRRLAVLGGGRLVADLIAEGLIEELFLTVCPLVLGGSAAPTPVDGLGFGAELAPRLELLSCRSEGQEVFLHYRLRQESLQPQQNSFTLENND